MNSRERILAALNRQPVDRIPFVPCLNAYAIRGFSPRYQTMKRWDVLRELGIDLLIRFRVGVRVRPPIVIVPPQKGPIELLSSDSRQWSMCQPATEKICIKEEVKGDLTQVTLETPIGVLRCGWRFLSTSDYPFPVEHLLKTVNDFEIYHYILEHTIVEPAYEEILDTLNAVGDEGTCEAAGGPTPVHTLLEYLIGIEKFYYCLMDYPKETEKLLDHIMEIRRQEYRILAESPAPIVVTGEDTSTTVMSPVYMERWEFPALNEFSDILHSCGKIHLVHMCGKLQNAMHILVKCHFDGIHDATPPPTGDLDFRMAREHLCAAGKCLVGGIDCNAFVNLSPEQLEDYIMKRLDEVAPGTGFLLGSGDTVPFGTSIKNLQAIVRTLEMHGRYPLS